MSKEESKTVQPRHQNFIQRYFRETVGELRKVNWPSRQETTSLTIVVLIVLAVMSTFLGVLDVVFNRVIGFIVGF